MRVLVKQQVPVYSSKFVCVFCLCVCVLGTLFMTHNAKQQLTFSMYVILHEVGYAVSVETKFAGSRTRDANTPVVFLS